MSIIKRISSLFRDKTDISTQADQAVVKAFKKRYARFRKLLDSNAQLAELLADLNDKLGGKSLFGFIYVRHVAATAVALTRKMADSLEGMNPGTYCQLQNTVNSIEQKLSAILGDNFSSSNDSADYTLPLRDIDISMVDIVGGKCANLGEMANKAGVPVPRGFAITTSAFHCFFAENGLGEEVERMLSLISLDDRFSLADTLAEIHKKIIAAPVPSALQEALEAAWDTSFADNINVRAAVRSSAQTEDGDKSFAGQFLTELNVERSGLMESYRNVIASLFSPSATLYRLHQGISLKSSAMAVVCLEMIDAKASGVAYSHDPVNLLNETIVINGVWGLGRYLVDGLVQPDMWIFSRTEPHELIRRKAGEKDKQLIIDSSGELTECLVSVAEQREFCLVAEQVAELTVLVAKLEKHYGCYQDVEWSLTKDNKIVLLQSRPLDIRSGQQKHLKTPVIENYPLLLEGGDIAYAGIGHGPVVIPQKPQDLVDFPLGGVLVASQSSAEYAAVSDRAQAIVTEKGGITGHMATICREFHIPAILNLPHAASVLKPGTVVTVDALSGRIYAGVVDELLPLRMELEPVRLKDTPIYSVLKQAARLITPLNLTDPASAKFSPAGCETLHDIMRFAHELSYHEMFAISDSAVNAGSVALKLKAPLPIDLHLIDLDHGTKAKPGARSVVPEEITSAPLKAMLGGMLRPEVVFRKPRPINMGGMMSVMSQQMINPQGGDGRFGDKSYAIISDRYMNFSSRVGYHYSVLDSYCGDTMSKNYIAFSFQGGAAGELRRERRCRAIALVLKELGFNVTQQGDMVKSRIQKYEKKHIEGILDQIGRLLQVTRQMDMLMVNEEAVVQFKEDFMNGIYR